VTPSDGDAHFEFGRLDGDSQPRVEARDQAVVDTRNFLRVGIAGDNHLSLVGHQGFEGVEEFFLGARFAGKELNIVDQQQVERVVIAFELVESLALVGFHHVRYVLFRMDVANPRVGVFVEHLVADGVDQVGFTQADAAVQKQRVIRNARIAGHLDGGGAGQLVGFTGDEVVEGQHRVQLGAFVGRIAFGAGPAARTGPPGALAGGGFVRVEAGQVEVGGIGGRAAGDQGAGAMHRAAVVGRCRRIAAALAGRAVGAGLAGFGVEHEQHFDGRAPELAGEIGDASGKLVFHPVELEAVRCCDPQGIGVFVEGDQCQWFDPRLELLRREFAL